MRKAAASEAARPDIDFFRQQGDLQRNIFIFKEDAHMKKMLALALLAAVLPVFPASVAQAKDKEEVVVYNWGEYMDPDVIADFEKETGIKVVYEEFETNEIM